MSSDKRVRLNAKDISMMSLFLSLGIIFEYISGLLLILKLPQGGNISLGVIPLIISGYYLGRKKSLVIIFSFCLVSLSIQTLYIVNWIQFLLDYFVAYLVYALSPSFPNLQMNETVFPTGVIVVNIMRFLVHTLSGVFFFSKLYSTNVIAGIMFYNFIYIFPTMVIGMVFITLLNKKFKFLKK